MRKLALAIAAALSMILLPTPASASGPTQVTGSLNFPHSPIVAPDLTKTLTNSLKHVQRQKRAYKKGNIRHYQLLDTQACHKKLKELQATKDYSRYSLRSGNCKVQAPRFEPYQPQSDFYIDSWNRLPLPESAASNAVADTPNEIWDMLESYSLSPGRVEAIDSALESHELKQARMTSSGVKLLYLRDWGSELWIEDAATGQTVSFIDARCFSEPPFFFQDQVAIHLS